MKKNAFTLVELLAVIILLAVIALIATPKIMESVESSKKESFKISLDGIYRAVNQDYMMNNMNGSSLYKYENKKLMKVTENGISLVTPEEIDLEGKILEGKGTVNIDEDGNILVKIENDKWCGFNTINDKSIVIKDGACDAIYVDKSGANIPEVDNGLVPVLYNGTDWVVADTSQKWYDYDNKEWANAIIVKTDKKAEYIANKVVLEDDVLAYYVWIPKYEYKINGKEEEISVNFKKGTDEVATADYTMHPAFTFGTTKLNGIWIGKFELTGDITTPTVKPNVVSLRNQAVSSFFTTIQKIGNYGLTNSDSHMMKNTEWGAVAYLKQSKYGLGATDIAINANSSYLTGAGDYKTNINQSTTGNITGIYDMSGGAFEYVMGNLNNTISSSGFSTMPNAKYYDLYTTSTGIKGDATDVDGTNGWYGDYATFVNAGYPWFIRGGNYYGGTNIGVFYFYFNVGGANGDGGSRPIISRP